MYIHQNRKSGYRVGDSASNGMGIRMPWNGKRICHSRSGSMVYTQTAVSRNNSRVMSCHLLRGRVCSPCIGQNEQRGIDGGMSLE